MIKTCPYCREEWDTEETPGFQKRWCCRDCFLGDLDRHLEEQWEERVLRGKLNEDEHDR